MFKKLFQKKGEATTDQDTLRFKTTLSCQGCVATITPFLEQLDGIEEWSVDLTSPERILKVRGTVSPEAVIQKLEEAGYEAELLS